MPPGTLPEIPFATGMGTENERESADLQESVIGPDPVPRLLDPETGHHAADEAGLPEDVLVHPGEGLGAALE